MYLEQNVKEAFGRYPWEGNVRELANVIECGVSLADSGELIQMNHLPHYFIKQNEAAQNNLANVAELNSDRLMSGLNLTDYLSEVEKRLVRDAISSCGGNISKAADQLGITRQALQHKLRKIEME